MVNPTFYNDHEVSGYYLHGIDNAPIPSSVTRLRHDHGLQAVNPDAWYPATTVLDFYTAVGLADGGAFDLVDIGRHVSADFPLPTHVQTLREALDATPGMHRTAWRGRNPTELTVRWLGERHAQLVYHNMSFPEDFVHGFCYGLVERFCPADTQDINVQRVVRGQRYIFDLRW
jgi:hypothetical protein